MLVEKNKIYAYLAYNVDKKHVVDGLRVFTNPTDDIFRLRLAIYRPTGEENHYPGKLVFDTGEFSAGDKNAHVAAFEPIDICGVYWLAIVADSSGGDLKTVVESLSEEQDVMNMLFVEYPYGPFPSEFPHRAKPGYTNEHLIQVHESLKVEEL